MSETVGEFKNCNICIIGVEEVEEWKGQNKHEVIMAENLPKLTTDIKPQFYAVQKTTNRIRQHNTKQNENYAQAYHIQIAK